jgi:hypothetical protein
MTFQGDPNTPKRADDYIDRAPSDSSAGIIIGALAVLGVLALLIFGFSGDRSGDPVTPRSPGATAPTTVTPGPGNTPAPAPATKP